MSSSPYANNLPTIPAPLQEGDAAQSGSEQEEGEHKKIYVYHTEDGDIILSETLLTTAQDEPIPPIIESQEPETDECPISPNKIRPANVALVLSFLALSLLIAIGVLTPYQQPVTRALIRVPAVLLPLKTFTASAAVIPTGRKIYPATLAHGALIITNGSILSEELPQGMIFTGKDGTEVVTDAAVFVPAGSATSLGYATVSAHAVSNGKSGNIAPLDIESIEGTSLYIRNVQPFTGGAESYSVKVLTSQDREKALSQARVILLRQTLSGLLSRPCLEHITGTTSLHVAWTCQFVAYRVPALPHVRVQQVQVIGCTVFVTITYLPRLQHLETK